MESCKWCSTVGAQHAGREWQERLGSQLRGVGWEGACLAWQTKEPGTVFPLYSGHRRIFPRSTFHQG